MSAPYEYVVMPAPAQGIKAPGAKTAPERLGAALSQFLNEMGEAGWEFLRAETLPCEERVGFTGRKTTFQTMMVFRRPRAVEEAPEAPRSAPALRVEPVLHSPAPEPEAEEPPAPKPRRPRLGPAKG